MQTMTRREYDEFRRSVEDDRKMEVPEFIVEVPRGRTLRTIVQCDTDGEYRSLLKRSSPERPLRILWQRPSSPAFSREEKRPESDES